MKKRQTINDKRETIGIRYLHSFVQPIEFKNYIIIYQLIVSHVIIVYNFFSKTQVCNISVKSNPMHFRSAGDIVIEGESRSIRFGWWLPKKT